MSAIRKITEWEGETTRLVKLVGLKRHPNFPHGHNKRSGSFREIPNRQIEYVILHQLAGSFREGISNAVGLANFCTATPKYKLNEDGTLYLRNVRGRQKPKLIGGGRGWPGAAYTFLVPFRPEVVEGKLEVYRLWDDQWRTWHTGKHWNTRGVGVGFGGSLKTRRAPKWSAGHARDPYPTQFVAGTELITEYLLPKYGLTGEDLLGHFDAGKVTCPGDVLEAWVREQRGETVNWLEPGRAPWDDRDPELHAAAELDDRPLDTWEQRQQALVDLGYDLGEWGPNKDGVDGHPGFDTRSALEAFEGNEGLPVDGVWDDAVEKLLRETLHREALPV